MPYKMISGIVILIMIILNFSNYFVKNWMIMGLGAALFLLIMIIEELDKQNKPIYWLALVIYLLHQFEEHGIDLLGRNYFFIESINIRLSSHVGCLSQNLCPFNPESILYVNTLLVWLPMLLAISFGKRFKFVGHCAVSIILANALVHIFPAIADFNYNPGLFTAITLFVPFSIFYYRNALRQEKIEKKYLILSIIYGFGGHLFLLATTVASYVKEILDPQYYPFLLIIYAILPLAFSLFQGTKDKLND